MRLTKQTLADILNEIEMVDGRAVIPPGVLKKIDAIIAQNDAEREQDSEEEEGEALGQLIGYYEDAYDLTVEEAVSKIVRKLFRYEEQLEHNSL